MNGRREGFTLIELMIVLSLSSIMMMIAMPQIDLARTRAESGARAARMALIAAHQRAVLRQHDVVVEFDEDASRLHLFDDPNRSGRVEDGEREWYHALEQGVGFGRGLAPSGPAGTEAIGFEEGEGSLPAVVFHRAGSASEAAGFYVASGRAAQATRYVDEAFAITVTRATGRVEMHRIVDGAWREAF